jgi:hypothetical protein
MTQIMVGAKRMPTIDYMFLYTLKIMSKYLRFLFALIVVIFMAYYWLVGNSGVHTRSPIEPNSNISLGESVLFVTNELDPETNVINAGNRFDKGSSAKSPVGVEVRGRVTDQLG